MILVRGPGEQGQLVRFERDLRVTSCSAIRTRWYDSDWWRAESAGKLGGAMGETLSSPETSGGAEGSNPSPPSSGSDTSKGLGGAVVAAARDAERKEETIRNLGRTAVKNS